MSITSGKLTCITGPMFSGKTSKLLELIKANKRDVLVIKPALDTRYHSGHICTHTGEKLLATPLRSLKDGEKLLASYDVVAIDEVQFFGMEVKQTLLELKKQGKEIILSGLEKDYLHSAFGVLLSLEKHSDFYIRLKGKCNSCNNESTHTFRKQVEVKQVSIGASNEYKALCEACYEKEMNYEKIK